MRTTSNALHRSGRTRLAGLREELRARRQAGVDYRNLERALASYRTPSEINDLLAAVDRRGDDSPQAEQIRGILATNLARSRGRRFAA